MHMHINETNHATLGTGKADFHAILKTLKDLNYSGYMSVYMPFLSQEAWQRTGEKVHLPDCLEWALGYLKTIERAVDLKRGMYDPSAFYADIRS
jgi:sugar phosphate isomerase/epimerase